MNDKLKNIFVPYEIAKLAYEKGFREWCACIGENRCNIFLNSEGEYIDFDYMGVPINGYYGLPTHFQLISWLKINHDIDVSNSALGFTGKWVVIDVTGCHVCNLKMDDEFEINEAIEVALNILPDKQ